MASKSPIYCFKAAYSLSTYCDKDQVPDWLSLEVNWQGYRISTVPWVADVAKVLGILEVEDTPEGWLSYLENLGFKKVTQVHCEEFFEDKLYC